ncbi:hypothetical protein FJR11_20310 [Anabaena sp. UHCC 0187]|uniref:hypothetical protein n=1 Tax=Anabaena sp. UHCC 0187 TaxID=2590018 RepID=UPI00144507F5|nr:hypothetical protein [Anabaena sp. UHCC 0187]MTJ12215.1 hypothetical protein [Anabaena sp. UHCC 0187]MTJ14876.1 hypothetical protein [Anabaena sp. UHCC 0187]
MRITTVQELREKLDGFDNDTPIFVDYQGVQFNAEQVKECGDSLVIGIGYNNDREEDDLAGEE